MAVISINDVRGCVLKSVEQAALNFEKWTRNFWVTDYGAEGLIQARVAENLFNLQKKNKNQELAVGIEMSVSDLMSYEVSADHKRKLESAVIQENSRPDVCMWDKKGRVPYIIEIKRHWENGTAEKDIQRCGDFLRIFGSEDGAGTRAAYFALILHRSIRNQGRMFFDLDMDLDVGKREGEQILKKKTEQFLKEKAEAFLEDGRRAKLKVSAEVSKVHGFEHIKNWPADASSEENAHHWKWRAAVVQIERAKVP
ncbi:MAG: hypothetical protein P1V34_19790 [Alphaproteobacteria bacterium]|nr:hypothetical protein [Alphaproteobacteria bacterium]